MTENDKLMRMLERQQSRTLTLVCCEHPSNHISNELLLLIKSERLLGREVSARKCWRWHLSIFTNEKEIDKWSQAFSSRKEAMSAYVNTPIFNSSSSTRGTSTRVNGEILKWRDKV